MIANHHPAEKKLILVENHIDLGYPVYPSGEDIYAVYQKGEEIDPEDILHLKAINTDNKDRNKEIFTEFSVDGDLDIPGAELDDLQEELGSEDEENNYYSIGGDDHLDLDEHQEK